MEDKSLQLQALIEKEPLFQNPAKKEAYFALAELVEHKLPETKSLPAFYQVLQEIITEINKIYENLQCKTGCNRCCKFYGSPQMYKSEWDYITDFLAKNFDEKQIKRVYRKFKENLDSLKDTLETDIASAENNDNFSVYVFLISECPFLHKGSCSIYEARPMICRIFGNSLIAKPGAPLNQSVLTCNEERERWENENKPGQSIFLPYKEQLEVTLLKITKPDERYYNTIQYWLSEYFNEY